ncbi:hypothetical protein SAMN05192534_1351 [Alteribacillus persepolensis]|uniref:Uncharacterized protein n=1 Tax=Alteribacillus persepolensis TaxID=568899 RepID=A0A1G8JNA7_9BACI|nr:hypothetical protein [Alteribacillus persepolensis]SDI32675.1 hypothetical protein SAMN05192534_1351 [Alteribacillus persepolensis]
MGVRKPQIELFQTQTQGTMLITSPGRYNVLTLPVTTTEAGQRVKLDSMVSISYTTLQLATQYGFEILYFLLRNGGTISSMRSRL